MSLTFGPPEVGGDGVTSIRRSPDKVIYVRWGNQGPVDPPSGENWLMAGDTDIRFMYHPTSGVVLFYIGGLQKSHASLISKPRNQCGLSLPPYDTWVRADSRRKSWVFIKTDELRLGRRAKSRKVKFRNLATMLRRLRTLKAIPCDCPVRIDLLSKEGKLRGGKRTWTLVRDWCKRCED